MFVLNAILGVFWAGAAAESAPALGWDRQKAFDYLESRQRQWANWKPAQKTGGACISCHTGLSYLFARRVLAENQPRHLERDLVQGVRRRLMSDPPKTMLSDSGAEAILSLLTLSLQRRSPEDPLDEPERVALRRLSEVQFKQGEASGSWTWIMHDLHPVESEHSTFFGAALAAEALSAYPANSGGGTDSLNAYLKREAPKQPLHNRLAWIAFSPSAGKEARKEVLRDLWTAQSSDGGWSNAALGPWSLHAEAPLDSGTNAYATGWAAFTARESGVRCSDSRLKRALSWLARHQDRSTGAWHSVSMNKVFPEGSMQSGFMTDAATGYATAALAGCRE